MEKAKKVRKIVTRVSAGVMLAALLMFNLQLSWQSNGRSQLSLSDLTVGLFTPAAYASGSGGCGVCSDNCNPGNENCIYANCGSGTFMCQGKLK